MRRTNEKAECRAPTEGDETYDGMSDDVDWTGDGGPTHTSTFGSLSDTSSQSFSIACQDTPGNKNDASDNNDTSAEIDTAVPTQSSHDPAKSSTITTTSPTITFTTNENGNCRASLTDESDDGMSDNVDCTGDGGTSQTCIKSGVSERAEIY